MKKKRLKYSIILAIIIVVIGIIVISLKNGDEIAEEVKPKKQVQIQTIEKQNEVSSTLTASGTVIPKQYTVIRSLVQGTLEYITPVGTDVTTGESLFRIRDGSIENNYFNALQNLNQTNVAVADRISQAELGLNSAQARFELAQKNLETVKKQTDQASGSTKDAAIITYNTANNTLNQVYTYISVGNITNYDYLYYGISTSDSNLLNEAHLQYLVSAEKYLAFFGEIDEDNLVASLNELEPVLRETKTILDMTVLLLQNASGGQGLENRNLANDRVIVAGYQTQINQYITSIQSSKNALTNTDINNQLSIDTAENQLALAQIELDNANISLQNAQTSAELERNFAQGQFDNASYGYGNLTLNSPFSGTVLSQFIEPGQQVSMGQEIIELGNLSIVEIKIDVDSEFAKGLKLNDEVLIDGQIKGMITELEPTGNITSGKVGVTVQSENADEGLAAGDIADVTLSLNYQETGLIVIPINAATIEPTQTYVFVEQDGKAVKKTVTLGKVFGNKVSVTDGLVEGDNLILRNGVFISENIEIEIIK
ncbi:efflux RND transporter periplasmic adaptor subunit [Patescibacteria group bacterium]|nr:efflux RND transporter periplasmic adaptor subunit [Patescibacteria group bacterium]